MALNDNEPSSSTQHSECDLESTQSLGLSQPQDYEHLYNKLLLEHEKLLTIKKSEVDYKKINENLRFQVRDLEKNLKVTNLILKNTEKIMQDKYNYYQKIKPETLIYKPENICHQYSPKIN